MSKIINSIVKALHSKPFPGARIFVLSCDEDKAFCNQLNEGLRNLGYKYWDEESCVLPGQNSIMEMERAIFDSEFVLVVMSDMSSRDEGLYQKLLHKVLEEQAAKSDGGIKLISIFIDETELPWAFRKYHPLDMTEPENAKMIARSFDTELKRRQAKKIPLKKSIAIWI